MNVDHEIESLERTVESLKRLSLSAKRRRLEILIAMSTARSVANRLEEIANGPIDVAHVVVDTFDAIVERSRSRKSG